MSDYVKVVRDDIAYYIHDTHVECAKNESARLNSKWVRDLVYDCVLMRYSECVVNTRTNELLKCRPTIEDVIDRACGLKVVDTQLQTV